MRSAIRLLVCTALAAFVSSTAHATVIWRGDFSTGNLSQWSSKETVAPSHLQVVTSPVPDGEQYALQVLIQQSDVIFGGNRDELDYETDQPKEGDERYYHWQTLWPSDYQSPPYWQLFTQWHQYISGGSPPLAFFANGENIYFADSTNHTYWSGPLQRGAWHDFVVHIIWSSNASVGAVELWYDGQHVLPLTHGATLFAGDTIYLKQGLYRKSVITFDQTIYHAGMTVATTFADVSGSILPGGAQDAGTVVTPDAGSSTGTTTGGGTGEVDAGTSYSGGGTTTPDAGSYGGHHGGYQPDAGTPAVDAGTVDAGTTAGSTGVSTTTASTGTTGSTTTTSQELGGSTVKQPTTGCSSAGASWASALAIAGAWLMRRRLKSNSRSA